MQMVCPQEIIAQKLSSEADNGQTYREARLRSCICEIFVQDGRLFDTSKSYEAIGNWKCDADSLLKYSRVRYPLLNFDMYVSL